MKQIILSFLAICLSLTGTAQITVTNSTFPVAGDVLKTAETSNLSKALELGDVGGPQTWDFSQLKSGTRIVSNCKNAADGPDFANFPTAKLLINEAGADQYYDVTPTKMTLVGLGGANQFLPVNVAVKYEKLPVFRRAPLTFIQSTTSEGKFNLAVDAAIIPDTILSTLPIKIDSIKIQFSNVQTGIVDAYGKVNMQNKVTDVLREKVLSITERKAFAKVSFLGWQDLSLFAALLPAGLGSLLGKDTTIIYNYYSGTHKEVLVSAEYDNNGVFQTVRFADLGGLVATENTIVDQTNILVFPNPTMDYVNVSLKNMKADQYIIVMNNVDAKTVYFDIQQMSGDFSTKINTQHLPSGLYVVQIFNKTRSTIYTQKVVKQ